jgi:hypothetical protein
MLGMEMSMFDLFLSCFLSFFSLSFQIFYVIRSFLAGLLPGKEVIVDSWPEWSSVVVRTCSEEKVGIIKPIIFPT